MSDIEEWRTDLEYIFNYLSVPYIHGSIVNKEDSTYPSDVFYSNDERINRIKNMHKYVMIASIHWSIPRNNNGPEYSTLLGQLTGLYHGFSWENKI